MSDESTLKLIKRNNIGYGLSNFKILVDNQEIGTVDTGKENIFPISAGNHTIVIQAPFGEQAKVEVICEPSKTKTLECGFKNRMILHYIILIVCICWLIATTSFEPIRLIIAFCAFIFLWLFAKSPRLYLKTLD